MKHEKNAKKCIFNFFFRRPIFRPSIAQWPIFCIRWKALNVLYNFDFMDFFVRGRLHIIKLTGAAALSFGTGTQKDPLEMVRISYRSNYFSLSWPWNIGLWTRISTLYLFPIRPFFITIDILIKSFNLRLTE